MTKNFKSFLGENSLYSNDAERAALLADKDRVAAAFMFNFLGMLGMINATNATQRGTIIKFLRKDKQVRLGSIGDDNHDISLSVKLAHEAGFFKQDITANEITKFLFKLKSGQIDSIDSNVVAGWLRGMVPSFRLNIKDTKMRQVFDDFVGGGGTTVDVSRFAVQLKKRVNTVDGGGDYQKYAKRFFGLTEITPQPAGMSPMATAATPAVPAVPTPIVDPSAQVGTAPTPAVAPPMNYYQRQKLKKLAALTGAPVDPVVATPTAPKLNYYQRQKLIKQAAAQQAQQAIDAQAAIDQKVIDDQAAADQKEREAAQALVASNIDIDQLIDEGIKILIDIHTDDINHNYRLEAAALKFIKTKYNLADTLLYAVKLPDAPRKAYEAIYKTVYNVENYFQAFRDRDTSQDFTSVLKQANAVRKTKYTPIGFLEMFVDQIYSSGNTASYRQSSIEGLVHAALEIEAKDPLIKRIVYINNKNNNYLLSEVYNKTVEEKQKRRLISFMVSDPETSSKIPIKNVFNGIIRQYPDGNIRYTYGDGSILLDFVAAQSIDFLSTVYNDMVSDGMFTGSFIRLLIVSGNSRSTIGYNPELFKRATIARIEEMAQYFIRVDLFPTYEASIVPKLFEEFTKEEVYNTQAPQNGGVLFELLHDRYAADLVDVGFEKSAIGRIIGANNPDKIVNVVRTLNIDLDQMMDNFPSDVALVGVKVRRDGVADLDTQVLANFLESRNDFYGNVSVARFAPGDKDKINDALAKASLIIAKKDTGFDFDTSKGGNTIMNLLSSATSETVLEWMRFAKSSNKKYIMSADLYKDINKDNKGKYVEVLTGIILDAIGTDVEDYVNDIIDGLAPHVVQKIRMSLVGSQVLIDEISSGDIKPFDKIDKNRLKQLFLYNDIDLSAIVSGTVSKKKKGETYTQFFARAKATIAQKGTILPEPDVAKNDTINVNALNKTIIQRDHAGKHGDVFPKILNVYDGTTDNPLFDDFRNNKFGDGTVEPAYHGTGGIAASMILRYGFRVIKPSDSGVVGRMLGDGIYFSNKVDKALQYVSNGGYSRRAGQKGYLFSMDVNLGKKRTDYEVAGVPGAGGGIRSPEWCVFNPPAQLRIQQVYEVELTTKQNVDKHLAEGVYSNNNNKVSTFKNYITEELMSNYAPTTTFIFRDGMIPIVDVETNEIEYVDFQEALQEGKLPKELYDITSQGPAVVFPSATVSEVYDERYAGLLVGDGLVLYMEQFVAYLKENTPTTI